MSCLYLSGRDGAQLKRYRPVFPAKPANLTLRVQVPGGDVSLPSLAPASSASSLSSCASSTSGSSSTYSRRPLQRRRAVIPDTVRLPPGVLLQSASSPPHTPPRDRALNYFRRKDQPGRRKDSTQSLYIDSPESDVLLRFSSCPPSSSSSSTSIVADHQNDDPQASKGQRRFSDPDIPCMDEDVC